ncbi:hypothetical protein Pcinc_042703 [Petrolisthes cinctipes]|uniref:Uncharacterized protein n=1 Tax=Petrolisthes cinctipes TaxID=88211 RepID=A0AAE1BH63_PETCI|nr:hypothetical protein Pcinc_042703 [Petrolisthes cinctipes]
MVKRWGEEGEAFGGQEGDNLSFNGKPTGAKVRTSWCDERDGLECEGKQVRVRKETNHSQKRDRSWSGMETRWQWLEWGWQVAVAGMEMAGGSGWNVDGRWQGLEWGWQVAGAGMGYGTWQGLEWRCTNHHPSLLTLSPPIPPYPITTHPSLSYHHPSLLILSPPNPPGPATPPYPITTHPSLPYHHPPLLTLSPTTPVSPAPPTPPYPITTHPIPPYPITTQPTPVSPGPGGDNNIWTPLRDSVKRENKATVASWSGCQDGYSQSLVRLYTVVVVVVVMVVEVHY